MLFLQQNLEQIKLKKKNGNAFVGLFLFLRKQLTINLKLECSKSNLFTVFSVKIGQRTLTYLLLIITKLKIKISTRKHIITCVTSNNVLIFLVFKLNTCKIVQVIFFYFM